MMPEAEEHDGRNPDERSGETDVDEASHVEGGCGDHSRVGHDSDEEGGDEIPELLDTDVEEAAAPGDIHRAA